MIPQWKIAAARGRAGGALALLLLLPVTGCKMMTDAQLAALQQQEQAEEARAAQQETNTARLEKVDEERQQLEFRIADRDARSSRMARFEEARIAYDSGDATTALQVISEVLEANDRSIELYAAARAEGEERTYLSRTVEVDDPKSTVPGAKLIREELIPTPMEAADRSEFLVLRGAARYDSGRTEEGLADFEEATRLNPRNRVARINFGKLLFAKGDWRSALAAWKSELADGYRSAELLDLIGQALFELARETNDPSLYEASRQALLEAFVADPENAALQRWLGNLEYQTGRYDRALQYFRGILARTPLDPTFLELVGNCLIELDRLEEAADTFELLARVHPERNRARVCRTISDLYAELRLPDRAASWLRRSFEGEGMPSEARLSLAYFLEGAGQLEDALEELSRIPADAQEFIEAQGIAAELEITLLRHDAARERLGRLVELSPEDGRIRISAGDLAMQRKDFEEALRFYNLAAAIPDTKSRGLVGAAEAYYELGNLAKSIAYYEDALEHSPENAAYRAALGEIRTEQEFRASAVKGDQ
ncbi:MAG: tetratricopeptide repeat protein [Planctomycetota bacterium]